MNSTSAPGTTFHTVQATATNAIEEVYLYALNNATDDSVFTCEIGGTGTEDRLAFTVPAEDGLYQVLPGVPFTATTSVITGIATATGRLSMVGWVNRAT